MVNIPDQIRDYLTDEEIENIESRNGWAVGDVALLEDGEVTEQISNAFIELYNGEGRAGEFGGVGVMAVDSDGSYKEVKAYATREAVENSSRETGWFVVEFTDPSNPDYGQPAP